MLAAFCLTEPQAGSDAAALKTRAWTEPARRNFRKSVEVPLLGAAVCRIHEEVPMASEMLHEDAATIGPAAVDRHRAIVSLMEELEAVDWYDQRAAAAGDEALRAILVHNRDEETEHAAMMLEWLRRQDPVLDAHLRKYLFTEGPIGEREALEASAPAPEAPANDDLAIGSLKTAAED